MVRVLVFVPMARYEPRTIHAVMTQDYDGSRDYLLSFDNPHTNDDDGRANILYNYRKARRVFLDSDYTHLFIVEHDILPPPDALTRLLAVNTHAAYGLYCFRRNGSHNVNVTRYTSGEWPDMSLSSFMDELQAAWNRVVLCSGSGLGCVLLQRSVMEQVDFRLTDKPVHCDTHFTDDVWRRGFDMRADMAVQCGHILPDGAVLWPDVVSGYRIERTTHES